MKGEIRLPESKSIAARLLTASLLSGCNPERINNLPECDDTDKLLSAVKAIGEGGKVSIDIGEGGTTFRFLLSAVASIPGSDVEMKLSRGLASRPVMPLVEALRSMGAEIEGAGEEYQIKGRPLQGGEIEIDGSVSSQFISSLMLAAPYWEKGATIRIVGSAVSASYLRMTAAIMSALGAKVEFSDGMRHIRIERGGYHFPDSLSVEKDWSGASYFFEEEYLRGFETGDSPDFDKLEKDLGLTSPEVSLQGDSRCGDLFRRLYETSIGETFSADMNDTPDLVPALLIAGVVSGKRMELNGIGHLRFKESDRLSALQRELGKLGYTIEIETGGTLRYDGKRLINKDCDAERVSISTYGDHRIAMAFAPLAKRGEVVIEHPEVVDKSFPGFWDMFPGFWV